MSKSIAIITLSTRTPRIGPHVAALVKSILEPEAKAASVTLASIDLADFKLPVVRLPPPPFSPKPPPLTPIPLSTTKPSSPA